MTAASFFLMLEASRSMAAEILRFIHSVAWKNEEFGGVMAVTRDASRFREGAHLGLNSDYVNVHVDAVERHLK